MIITIPWLKEHLKTSAKENEIIDRLTNIGLEVEGVKENSGEMGKFKIAKVLKAEKHPNADKLKICDVTIGGNEILKVVCGAPNAREGLITIYAPPGAVIPKTNKMLVMFEPTALPTAVSVLFAKAAEADTIISGAEEPIATTVKPTISVGTPKFLASAAAP